jgi:hypothetical protein
LRSSDIQGIKARLQPELANELSCVVEARFVQVPAGSGRTQGIVEGLDLLLLDVLHGVAPLQHHFELLAALIQLLELSPLLRDHRIVVEQPIGFPGVALKASGDEVHHIILAALTDRMDVIEAKDDLRRGLPAILAAEAIALEDLEPGLLRNGFSIGHGFLEWINACGNCRHGLRAW